MLRSLPGRAISARGISGQSGRASHTLRGLRAMATDTDCLNPGTFWDGEPKGKVIKLGGLDAYFAESSKPSGIAVLMASDIFGWEAKNARLMADKFAASGITAALPDFFHGEKCPVEELTSEDKPKYSAWAAKHVPDAAKPDAEKVIAELQAKYGQKSVGVIGFCWGGALAIVMAAEDKVKAAIVNHGARLTQAKFEAVKQPIMVNGSDNDSHVPKELLKEFEDILKKKNVPSNVKFFPGSFHGWTCRGDVKDPKMGPLVVDAYDRAVTWLQKHL